MKVKKEDTVLVVSGNARGKKGRILKVFPKENRVIVEGVNLIKRHTKPSQRNAQGGIVEKEAPIDASNVMVICNKCGEPSRIGYKTLDEGGKKSRKKKKKKCDEMM